MAMAAGLGECSRMGLLITPQFGPRVRLCKVFTDMPLVPDFYRPFGVTEFCHTCRVCSQTCPSQSISNNPPAREGKNRSNHNGPLKWYNDHERCLRYWAKIRTDCIQCIRICPFNKPLGRLHDFSRLMIGRKIPVLNRLLVSLDRLLGYHRTLSHTRFWGS